MTNPVHGLIAGATLFAGAALAEINLSDGDLPDLKISGWVDFNYVQGDQDAASANFAAAGIGEADVLSLNEVEINFHFDFGNGLTAKFDLQADSAGQTGTATDIDDVELEEAYFSYNFLDGEDSSLSLTAGRFFSGLGFEAYDLSGLYQFSAGYGPNRILGLQDGVRLDYSSEMFALSASVVDGIFTRDQAFNTGANDLGFEFSAKFTGVENLEVFAGYAFEDSGTAASDGEIFNIWASYQIGDLLLAVEYTDGSDILTNDGDSFLVMANYAVNDWLAFTARYSQTDIEASATGAEIAELDEYTLAALFTVHDNLGIIVEYRHDEDDTLDAEADTLAIEATLTF